MQCRHCGTRLTKKELKNGVFTCPGCGARFRLNGGKNARRKQNKKDVPALIAALVILIALLIGTVCYLYKSTIPAEASAPAQLIEETSAE